MKNVFVVNEKKEVYSLLFLFSLCVSWNDTFEFFLYCHDSSLSLCLMMFLWCDCDDDFRRTPGMTTAMMMMMMVNSRKEWKKQHHFPGGKHSRWSWFTKREGFLHDSEEERDKRRTKESSSWVGFQRRDHDQNCHHHHQFRFKKERILFVPDFMREKFHFRHQQ